ncbi:MAG TPA: rod shape-determining protein MreC [Ilumatobacteraceae bacterium]|nr:rod shape-determining protein MreC [Ilumatobacteraceae bacterium]
MFFSLSRKRVIVLVILTCLLLITLDKQGNPVIDKARAGFAVVLRPFDTAIEAVALPIERAWNGIMNYDDVERENEALRDQLAQMRGNDIEAQSAILEYRELLKVNQLASKFQYPVQGAQVVGESPSNFQNTVEINVGSNKGIEVGMPVTDGAGLVGKITRVFPDRSIVQLLTDPNYSVRAQVLSTPDQIEEEEQPTSSTTPSGVPVDDLGTTTTTTTPPSSTTTTTIGAGGTGNSTTTTAGSSTTTTDLRVVRETGMLEGQGANRPLVLRLVDVSSSLANVKVGAIVDTAGGNNSLAPQGIPIGVISRIVEQSGSRAAVVEVTPSASLNRLNFVAVVLYVPNDDAVGR